VKKLSRSLSDYSPQIILTLLGFLIYSNIFRAQFQFDDHSVIVENPFIRNLLDIPAIWNAFNTRFVTGLSLAFNYHLGKLDVLSYHVFNVSVHVLNSLLVYWFCVLTFETPNLSGSELAKQKKQIGLFASLLFLTHPIQTQTVIYIWQRSASLTTLFYTASLICYIKSRLGSSKIYYFISFLCAVCAMFSKEIAITLPFALALYECSFLGSAGESKMNRFYKILPFLCLVPVIPLTLTRAPGITLDLMRSHLNSSNSYLNFESMTRGVDEDMMPRSAYILTQINVLMTYLRLLILPINQNLDYDYPLARSFFEPGTLLSFALLLGVIIAGALLFKKHRLAAFGIFWFFLTLSLESLIPQSETIFEHRLYLPIIGFVFFVAYWFFFFLKKKTPATSMIVMILLIGISCALTYQRNGIWKDEVTLWTDVIKKSPGKARGYNNRGNAYHNIGRFDQAITDFDKAIQIQPAYEAYYNRRGNAYLAKGLSDQAVLDYNQAIQIEPDYSEALFGRGNAYLSQNLLDQAVSDYTKAIQIKPDYVEAYNNRAIAYHDQGLIDQSLEDYAKIIQIKPDYAEAYNNRGVIYQSKGMLDQAVSDYTKAIQIKPDYADAHKNLAVIRSQKFPEEASQ